MNKFLILLFFILCSGILFPQSSSLLLYEKKFTSVTGAEGLLTLHKAFYSFEEKFLPPNPFENQKKSSKIYNGIYRAVKTAAIDYPVDYLIGLTQHEVFGHGARFNEFNYTNCSFHLSLPFPYGKGHGFAEGYPPINSTLDQSMSMIVSGNESNTVLSEILRTKWLTDDSIHYRDFFLYAGGFHNTTQYIVTNLKKSYGDIASYLLDIEIKYYSETGKKYTIDDLKKFAFINLLDPFQYIAFFNWANYLASGKQKEKLLMIKLGKLRYLPSFNLGLSPFGAEFYFYNYLKSEKHLYKFFFRYGDPKFVNFYGGGISATNIIHRKNFLFDATADFWNQPSLTLQDEKNKTRKTNDGFGTCLSGTLSCHIMNKVNLVLISGYKTDGFVQGEALSKGFFLRTGFGFHY
ncbi:MAG: hypothetical protein V1904_02910 [Bacteroidota bacterium]